MRLVVGLSLTFILSPTFWAQDTSALDAAQLQAIVSALNHKTLPVSGLVPRGFTKVAEAKGDLNQDGVDDMVLIVRKKSGSPDPAADEFLPQVVLLFLGDRTGMFRFWKIGAHHFVDNNPTFMSDGGVEQLAIVNGVLHIASNTAVSIGTWYVNTCTQKWRNEKAGFRLIGLTAGEIHRGCGCGRASDTNFLTGDQILTDDRGPDMTRAKRPVRTRTKSASRTILWEDFKFDSYCSVAEE